MNEPDPIRQYLTELATRLSAVGSSRRILGEVEEHLRQRADALQADGRERPDAEREAIARFGTVAQIASRFEHQPPLPCEEQIMIRHSLTGLAAITSLYAALLAIFAFINAPTAAFTYVVVGCAAMVIGCGVLIVGWQWTARPLTEFQRIAIFVGGLALIEIGTANVVWTAHLGLVSGDWEYYGFVGGILISVLGALATIWLAFPDILTSKDGPYLTHASR